MEEVQVEVEMVIQATTEHTMYLTDCSIFRYCTPYLVCEP